MPETPTPPSSTEKTVVVNSNHLCRLWTLTYISLGLNALILALLLVCAILHHHKHHGFGGGAGGDGGRFGGQRQMGGHGFHHGGGMDRDRSWGRSGGGSGGFGGGRFGENGPGGGFRGQDGGDGFRNHGNNNQGFGGRNGGPGGGPGMPGMRGMMGGERNGPPDPAKMTDSILNHLSTTLSLTDDEKAKIKPIIQDQVTQMQKDMEAQRAAMQKQTQDLRAKIKPLLTADQQKQLDAMPTPGQKPPMHDAAKPNQPPGQ